MFVGEREKEREKKVRVRVRVKGEDGVRDMDEESHKFDENKREIERRSLKLKVEP